MASFSSPAGYTVRFGHPEVDLKRATTVKFDARQARRISLQTDQSSIERSLWATTMWMKVANSDNRVGTTTFAGLTSEVYAYSPPNLRVRFRQGPFDIALPLLTVRAEPPVSIENKSPSGPVEIPVSVTRQDGPATVAGLALEYSVDDGATWQQATVSAGKAAVTNPADGFVSLRTKATDTDGNAVTTTVIRAYEV